MTLTRPRVGAATEGGGCYGVRMTRTDARSASREVADVLGTLPAIVVAATAAGPHADLAIQTQGRIVEIEVRALRSPTPADVGRLAGEPPTENAVRLLIADRIVPRVRDQLRDAGWSWLDRRGHLFLLAPGVLIDTAVVPLDRVSRVRPVLDTDVGLDVAVAVLTQRHRKLSIRALVAFTGRSLGAVHHAIRGLTDDGLIGPDGLPLVPELFWEVSGRWQPTRIPLEMAPEPGAAKFDPGSPGEGWVLCDTLAANALGAEAVVRGDHPPDFYVPDDRAVRVARQLLGDASTAERRGATVALAPATWTCAHPVNTARHRRMQPTAHPVVVALDLSIDASRGREILDAWTPPEPYARVW